MTLTISSCRGVVCLTLGEQAREVVSCLELKAVLSREQYQALEDLPFKKIAERTIEGKNVPAFCVSKEASTEGFQLRIECAFFAGVDWVIPGGLSIRVLPKLTAKQVVDMPTMLATALSASQDISLFKGLLTILPREKPVPDAQDCERLLLFVAAAYLKVVRRIVRKGLQQSFRTEDAVLRYRIKGKLRVSETLLGMRMGDPFARTVCAPQRFDEDSPVNRFLKAVLKRVLTYLTLQVNPFHASRRVFIEEATWLLRAFRNVSDLQAWTERSVPTAVNPVFKDYVAAVNLGRRFMRFLGLGAFRAEDLQSIVPYWIDMAQLFELFVHAGLGRNPAVRCIEYHRNLKVGGIPDYLLEVDASKAPFGCCVADAKYKPVYEMSDAILSDARQVSGYSRLKEVIGWMLAHGFPNGRNIVPCLLIYPNQSNGGDGIDFNKLEPLVYWEGFWKLGIRLPIETSGDSQNPAGQA